MGGGAQLHTLPLQQLEYDLYSFSLISPTGTACVALQLTPPRGIGVQELNRNNLLGHPEEAEHWGEFRRTRARPRRGHNLSSEESPARALQDDRS